MKKKLPHKICIVCKRIFYWRKKWEKNWEKVKYCSHKCSKKRKTLINKGENYDTD